MGENTYFGEKERKFSLVEFANRAVRVPRTFVFDQKISENDYHLYIDPEEYYNEEFDTFREEFQHYRSSIIPKKPPMTTKSFQKRPQKTYRLCMTTENSKRVNLAKDLKSQENNTLEESILKSKQTVDQFTEDASQKPDSIAKDTTSKGFTQCKWNKKEMEMSKEIRENDKTQVLIEKTKRVIRKNEAECAKLKRRVNDENFGNDFKQNKTSIRKTNLALEAVFSENELAELLNNDEILAQQERISTFQGGYVSRYVDNDLLSSQKKGRNFGYGSKLLEQNYTSIVENTRKKKKNMNKTNMNQLLKGKMSEIRKDIEQETHQLLENVRNKGVFPEQVNQFRINAIKYVKLRKTEKRLENKLNFDEIQRKLRAGRSASNLRKTFKSASTLQVGMKSSQDNQFSPKKDSQMNFHGHLLSEDERKMLNYIKDVLTKPMNEGNPVILQEEKWEEGNEKLLSKCRKKREDNDNRLFLLRKNQVTPQKLNFFSLDRRVQNIKFENLHL